MATTDNFVTGDSPLFVVGAPRSGTTMMRLILNSHPNIAIPSETNYFPDVYWPYASQSPADWPRAVDSFVRICKERFRPMIDLAETASTLGGAPPDFGLLLALPLGTWAAAQGKRRWGEKTPLHMFYADVIMRLFPDAKIIAMQRDPRAVVASMNRFSAAGNDTVLNARLWHDVWTRGRDILYDSVPAAQRLTVRYEDLVQGPEQVMGAVCEFLQEEFDASMLTFGDTASGYIEVVRSAKIQQPIGGDPMAWRNELSDHQLALIECVCETPMAALGYRPSGRPPHRSERLEVAVKLAYVRYKQWQRRADRYCSVTYPPFGRIRRPLSRLGSHRRPPAESPLDDDDGHAGPAQSTSS